FGVITGGFSQDLTPQQFTSDFAPNFSTDGTTGIVSIVDNNISNVTTYDGVYFNTPISVGGIILSGFYQITAITGTHGYQITSPTASTGVVNNAGAVPTFTTTSGSALVAVGLNNHGVTAGSQVVFPIATTVGGLTIQGVYTVTTVT